MGKDKLDIKILKVLANHSDISTTESYLKDKDQEILNEAFGL
jgi:site-specific recombinase XerD